MLSELSATDLGGYAIRGCLSRMTGRIGEADIEAVVMGHVLAANCGQLPARQAATAAGLPPSVTCFSVDKVCASGMKAVMIAASSIRSGAESIVVAGGMESMSSVPYYVSGMRFGKRMGHDQLIDGLIKDGLWDVENNAHMGTCTEGVNITYSIEREDADAWAAATFGRASHASEAGLFKEEVVPITVVKNGISKILETDEQLQKVKIEKFSALRPSFKPDGIITPANASPISDGAAALLLMSRDAALERGVKPLVRIVAWADGSREPADFTIAPAVAILKVLALAKLTISDVGVWELNEAFSTAVLANQKILGDEFDLKNVNIFGGSLALGHPLGCSGARIICTLISAMRLRRARFGCAAICNGGGGASAIIVELE